MSTLERTLSSKAINSGNVNNKKARQLISSSPSCKTCAKSCKFGDQHDSMIQDQIVFGVTDIRLKERLLHESSDLTLEKKGNHFQSRRSKLNSNKERKDLGARHCYCTARCPKILHSYNT